MAHSSWRGRTRSSSLEPLLDDFKFPSMAERQEMYPATSSTSTASNRWMDRNPELAQDDVDFGFKREERSNVTFDEEWKHYKTGLGSFYREMSPDIAQWPGLKSDERKDPSSGYMARGSPFSLETVPLGMSFLDCFAKGNLTVTYSNDLGDVESVTGIDRQLIEERSFLLSQSIDSGRLGSKLHLECVSPSTIRPFLQYIYTGSYSLATPVGEILEDVPTSLLVHLQMYRLGDIYDISELKSCANVHIIRQCEFGCSSPNKPIDLCATIRYLYGHMQLHAGLKDTILNYCVSCFLTHALAQDPEFRELAHDLRQFNQDLCREGMNRCSEDESSEFVRPLTQSGTSTLTSLVTQAIIQMPFKRSAPETYSSREDGVGIRAAGVVDDVYHFHGEDGFAQHYPRKRKILPGDFDNEGISAPFAPRLWLQYKELDEIFGAEDAANNRQEASKRSESSGKNAQSDETSNGTDSTNRLQTNKRSEIQNPHMSEVWRRAGELDAQVSKAQAEDEREERDADTSDSEYEVVSGPSQVELLASDSESDPETSLVIHRTSSIDAQANILPFRPRSGARALPIVNSDFDTTAEDEEDWDLIEDM